jgi:hypothetical protein
MQGQSAEPEIKVTIVIVPSHFYLPSRCREIVIGFIATPQMEMEYSRLFSP